MAGFTKSQVAVIDGKTIRSAKSHGKKSPIHLVSAWAHENNLVLGQVKTEEKSNEITAIPSLVKRLLKVSLGLVFCQRKTMYRHEGCKGKVKALIEKHTPVDKNNKSIYPNIQDTFAGICFIQSE